MYPRIKTLAKNLINYSTNLEQGQKILIEVFDSGLPLVQALLEEVYKAKAIPFIEVKNNSLLRSLLLGATAEQIEATGHLEAARMRLVDAYIGIRGNDNASELADVPQEKMQLYQKYWTKPVHLDIRVPNTKWCVMRYPTPAMAQSAGMSTESFQDFYFNVCNLDYAKMGVAMDCLIELLNHTDHVHILGSETDLSFSIKNISAVKCSGLRNIPDGEVYTAPIKHSVNGKITYNTPAVYNGLTFENITLEFKDGKIINATANHTKEINEILDTDTGARYIGEFALGLNPHINLPMKDTLFDEKINGSFHFTPGNAYDISDNGNKSAIHWDLVSIQRPEYGGGDIWFDGKLIRKDGRFLLPSLNSLNPENLI